MNRHCLPTVSFSVALALALLWALTPTVSSAAEDAHHGDHGHAHGHADADESHVEVRHGDAYPLPTDPVTGESLAEVQQPIVVRHEGRVLHFASDDSAATFKAEPGEYLPKIDRQIVARQLATYPLDVCVISGEQLDSMGEPVNHVHGNRLVRFCCKGCVKPFEKDPGEALQQIDQAVARQQLDDYPLETCVVSGEPLDAMGDPVNYVHGTSLVRFCCAHCIGSFERNPAAYTEELPGDHEGGDGADGGGDDHHEHHGH